MVDASNFEKLFLDESTADVNFVFKTSTSKSSEDTEDKAKCVVQYVPAHKIILAASSTVFHTMFYGSLKEGAKVKIEDAPIEAFKQFIEFFYSPKPTISLEYVGDVLYLAEKYDLPKCKELCYDYMTKCINVQQAMSVYEPATRFNQKIIMEKCEQVIASNADKVLMSDAFFKCSADILKHITGIKTLSAQHKFKAAMEWSRNQCLLDGKDPDNMQNRREAMGECFQYIEFVGMQRLQLLECLQMHKNLFTFDELSELFKQVLAKCSY